MRIYVETPLPGVAMLRHLRGMTQPGWKGFGNSLSGVSKYLSIAIPCNVASAAVCSYMLTSTDVLL